MTNKRFENRLNKDNVKFNTLNPIWDNEKEDALNVFEMIDMLNHLHEENEQLKKQIGNLEHTRDFADEVCADCERLENENKQLKFQLQNTSDQRDEFYRGARENANRVGKLKKENEQLKEEKEKWKNNCSLAISENSILWNEINILREQGAEPSEAFNNYLNKKRRFLE